MEKKLIESIQYLAPIACMALIPIGLLAYFSIREYKRRKKEFNDLLHESYVHMQSYKNGRDKR